MRIVIADDSQGRAETVAEAARSLRHVCTATTPSALLSDMTVLADAEVAIVPIQSEAGLGLELAKAVRAAAPWVTVGFVAGTIEDIDRLDAARRAGPVLPGGWDMMDLVRFMDALSPGKRPPRRRFPAGTPPREDRIVDVQFTTWTSVLALCDGSATLFIPDQPQLIEGTRLTVTLHLPNGEQAEVPAHIAFVDDDPDAGITAYAEPEMTAVLRARLRRAAKKNGDPPPG